MRHYCEGRVRFGSWVFTVGDDVPHAIPFIAIKNSATEGPPEDLWGQIVSHITNMVVSVTNFIYNSLVALGNLIEKAGEVVGQFFLKLWNTAVSAVKTAVEVIKKVVSSIFEAIKNLIIKMITGPINYFKEQMNKWTSIIFDEYMVLVSKYKDENLGDKDVVKFIKDSGLGLIFGAGFALGIGIEIALIAVSTATFGIGTILMFVLPPVLMYIGEIIITNLESPGENNPVLKMVKEMLDAVVSTFKFAKEVIKDIGTSLVDKIAEAENKPYRTSGESVLWEIGAITTGWYGFVLGITISGLYGVVSFALSVASLVLNFISLTMNGKPIWEYHAIEIISIFAGALAVIFGAKGISENYVNPEDRDIAIGGAILGGISTFASIMSLVG